MHHCNRLRLPAQGCYRAEAARLWQWFRLARGEAAGREALAALQAFLVALNAAASVSLAEVGEQLIPLLQAIDIDGK